QFLFLAFRASESHTRRTALSARVSIGKTIARQQNRVRSCSLETAHARKSRGRSEARIQPEQSRPLWPRRRQIAFVRRFGELTSLSHRMGEDGRRPGDGF